MLLFLRAGVGLNDVFKHIKREAENGFKHGILSSDLVSDRQLFSTKHKF